MYLYIILGNFMRHSPIIKKVNFGGEQKLLLHIIRSENFIKINLWEAKNVMQKIINRMTGGNCIRVILQEYYR